MMLARVLEASGLFLLVMGTLWAFQGLGLVAWPQDSVMLGEPAWAARGGIAAVAGALVIWIGRHRARSRG
ncbi:MAG: hypothetical protein ACKO01_06020 [Erythrobacter sp.]